MASVDLFKDCDDEIRHALRRPFVSSSSFVTLPLVDLLLVGIDGAEEGWLLTLVDGDVALQAPHLGLQRLDFVADDLYSLCIEGVEFVVDISLFKREIGDLLRAKMAGGEAPQGQPRQNLLQTAGGTW